MEQMKLLNGFAIIFALKKRLKTKFAFKLSISANSIYKVLKCSKCHAKSLNTEKIKNYSKKFYKKIYAKILR